MAIEHRRCANRRPEELPYSIGPQNAQSQDENQIESIDKDFNMLSTGRQCAQNSESSRQLSKRASPQTGEAAKSNRFYKLLLEWNQRSIGDVRGKVYTEEEAYPEPLDLAHIPGIDCQTEQSSDHQIQEKDFQRDQVASQDRLKPLLRILRWWYNYRRRTWQHQEGVQCGKETNRHQRSQHQHSWRWKWKTYCWHKWEDQAMGETLRKLVISTNSGPSLPQHPQSIPCTSWYQST